ncbi:NUDIX domain-containing protein [Salinarimonas ramus]|uniref:GDP-mannose pyrophosphatase n=1 Tax=Salinarimonas ramus TaxID=690164 RepID=A0A917QAQ9_9HYPH|nr:NUDIX domain-containing protein [Salinarimonas ramus]GGK39695.1 NUDIX hydrolase [Salinarimonas ramus]
MSETHDERAGPRAVIRSREVLSDDWGVLTRYELSYRRYDGSWQDMTRETYDRGHGAVVLPYDPVRGTIVLTRQFRLPAFVTGHDEDLIEACAGLLDARDPETAIRKEAEEETGLTLGRIEKMGVFYMSPGSVTERLHFFLAPYESAVDTASVRGNAGEGEDIRVVEITLEEALAMIEDGRIVDAKTVMLVQHLALRALRADRP